MYGGISSVSQYFLLNIIHSWGKQVAVSNVAYLKKILATPFEPGSLEPSMGDLESAVQFPCVNVYHYSNFNGQMGRWTKRLT